MAKNTQRKYKKDNKGKLLLLSLLLVLALPITVLIAAQNTNTKSDAQVADTYLTRNGTQLMLNGRPYKFTGFNSFGLEGCEGIWYTDAEYDKYFSSLQPYSVTRTNAFEYWGFEQLDKIVASAERNHQLLILMLADGRAQCNDLDGANGGDGSGKSAAWYQGGYKTKYIPWAKQVVAKYKDSKAIGMWEIANEPGYDVPDTTMRAFFDDTAATIKSIDPNHLVETGTIGTYVKGTNDFAYVHGGPNVDVASIHEYDYDYNNSKVIESGWFKPALDEMNSINKPLIIGESGVNAAASNCLSNYAQRADVFKQKFDTYLSKGAAGVLVWNWTQAEYNTYCGWWVAPSDPLMAMMRAYPYPGMPVNGGGTTTAPVAPTNTPVVQQPAPTNTPVPVPPQRPTNTPVPPTSTPVPSNGANLLRNGSFESALSPWGLSVNTPAKATLTSDSSNRIDGNASAKVDITKKGSSYWQLQFTQGNISLAKGKTYTLTFWARASKSTSMDSAVQQVTSPYNVYTQNTVTVPTTWTKFTSTFNAFSAGSNVQAGFYLGNAAIGTVWIDNVTLISN